LEVEALYATTQKTILFIMAHHVNL